MHVYVMHVYVCAYTYIYIYICSMSALDIQQLLFGNRKHNKHEYTRCNTCKQCS